MKTSTGYAPVNGLQLYYELHGPETPGLPPVVLLHGGGDTIQTSFGTLLPELARTRRVIAFEQQGFGHTADIAERPFTFTQSADDTAALLDHLKIPQADVIGFSNGGTIALQLALRHPARVRRMVLISAFFSRAGGPPEFWAGFAGAKLEMMPRELREAYLAVAPHPENLQSFFDKCVQRMRDFPDISPEAMRSIRAPAFVIAGDRDVVLPGHAVETYRFLQHAWLAVLPATDHMQIMHRPALLAPRIEEFLAAEKP